MNAKHRSEREQELRCLLEDPVGRFVLERKFFEATKLLPPDNDSSLLEAILAYEFGQQTTAGMA